MRLHRIICGDALTELRKLQSESIHCCVTSPPYWGLRNYGVDGQLGLEKTPGMYVEKMVEIFSEVRRVLRPDGTLWLNLGDSYASGKGTCHNPGGNTSSFNVHLKVANVHSLDRGNKSTLATIGLKPKDLVGIPWAMAFALRSDGWYLRQDIIWHKPNPMPESVTDRCTKAHEYIFLMTKSERYYYDQESIKEPVKDAKQESRAEGRGAYRGQSAIRPRGKTRRYRKPVGWQGGAGSHDTMTHNTGDMQERRLRSYGKWSTESSQSSGRRIVENIKMARANGAPHDAPFGITRNRRSVWTVPTRPFKGAHFATFPPDLIRPCILAGCPKGGTVLDTFVGSGTTAIVARSLEREFIGIELNPVYCKMAVGRLRKEGSR